MKKPLFSGLLAICCAVSLAVPAAAADTGPVLTEGSNTTGYAKVYYYEPMKYHANGKSTFGETVYLSVNPRVYSDNGVLYSITETAPLENTELFSKKIKANQNAIAIDSVKALGDGDKRPDSGIGYKLSVADDYLYQNFSASFDVTYTAKRDTTLQVAGTGNNAGKKYTLEVKKGAKISSENKLRLNEDSLFPDWLLDPEHNLTDALSYEDPLIPNGTDQTILSPSTGSDADVSWKDLDYIVAELELGGGSLSFRPKLTTVWEDAGLSQKREFGKAYVRFFKNNPSITAGSGAVLTLTNPFLSVEGNETVAHKDVIIYECNDGKLTDVTQKFSYTTDSDGNGAFSIHTTTLGNYILSSVPLES